MRRRRKAGGPDETEIPLRRKDDPPACGQGRSPQGKRFVAGAVDLSPKGDPRRIRAAPAFDSLLGLGARLTPATARDFVEQRV